MVRPQAVEQKFAAEWRKENRGKGGPGEGDVGGPWGNRAADLNRGGGERGGWLVWIEVRSSQAEREEHSKRRQRGC